MIQGRTGYGQGQNDDRKNELTDVGATENTPRPLARGRVDRAGRMPGDRGHGLFGYSDVSIDQFHDEQTAVCQRYAPNDH